MKTPQATMDVSAVKSASQAAESLWLNRRGFAMPKYPGLTDRGKSMTDITAVVFVVLGLAALVAWMLTPGK